MSALVLGKRAAFEDLAVPGGASPSAAASQKRPRYRSTGGSPARFLNSNSTTGDWHSPAGPAAAADKLQILREIFPSMNPEELERALLECGHDLDLTIKGLNLLCLGAGSEAARESDSLRLGVRSHGSPEQHAAQGAGPSNTDAVADVAGADLAATAQAVVNGSAPGEEQQAHLQAQAEQARNGSGSTGPAQGEALAADISTVEASMLSVEWVDAVVQEMMSARDLDDARQRAARVLQSFGSAVLQKAQGCQEHKMQELKGQLALMQKENQILKRAVAIQHERQLAHEAKDAEVFTLKQTLTQYQEQLRKLEVNNYALSLHLQKAQVDTTMPNRFHPDIF